MAIDRHALKATARDEASLDALASYLQQPCRNDRDKARAIYRWITDRITYNLKGFFDNDHGDNSPAAVLKNRLAVCDGYSALFLSLSERMDLEAVRVVGIAKGLDTADSALLARQSHSWVAARINGAWRLVDATWGAGYANGRKFERHFNDYYFFPAPDQLIFTHFPKEASWQLLETPVAAEEFKRQPRVEPGLFRLGVSSEAVRAAFADNSTQEFVKVSPLVATRTRIVKVPLERVLVEAQTYEFRLESDDYSSMFLVNGGAMVPMRRRGKSFAAMARVTKGPLTVYAKASKNDRQAQGLLAYLVK